MFVYQRVLYIYISYHTFAHRGQTNRNSDGMWMQSVERWGERPNFWFFNDSNQPTKRQTVKIPSGKLTVCELEDHNLSWLNQIIMEHYHVHG